MQHMKRFVRVAGWWLFYALAGVFLLVALLGAAPAHVDLDDNAGPRTRTKVVAALSGVLLIVAALGWLLLHRNDVVPPWPWRIFVGGLCLGGVAAVLSWRLLDEDLKRR